MAVWVANGSPTVAVSISFHNVGRPKMSRAATQARRTSLDVAPVSSVIRVVEARPGVVDHLVDERRHDDLPSQPVALDPVTEAAAEGPRGSRRGGSATKYGSSARAVSPISVMSAILVWAKTTAISGTVRSATGRLAFTELLRRREELELAIEPPLEFQLIEVPGVHVGHRRRLHPGDAERPGLGPVVVEHELAATSSVIGGEQPVPIVGGQLAGLHRSIEEDLDVDLVIVSSRLRPSCRSHRC